MDDLTARYRDAIHREDWEVADALERELDAQDRARLEQLRAPGALLASALWYGEQGIPVFPLAPRGKRPVTRHGLKDASTDAAHIREWWTATPDANIGLPTGIVFDVIDVDGPQGVVSVSRYIESIRSRMLGMVTTPRAGGLHYYVPTDPAQKNTASKIAPGVDTRGVGGYVVAPPSITDEHGSNRMYEWVYPLDVTALRRAA